MGVIDMGTRANATVQQTARAPQGSLNGSLSTDPGMTKRVVGAIAFSAVPPRATLAGSFGAFAVSDQVLVEGTVSNQGFFQVTGVAADYLTLDPPPEPENAPATAVLRTA